MLLAHGWCGSPPPVLTSHYTVWSFCCLPSYYSFGFQRPTGVSESENQMASAARRAISLVQVYEKQRLKLQELALIKIAKLEFDCVAAIAEMELAGILLDTERWKALIAITAKQHKELADEIKQQLQPANSQLNLFQEAQLNLDSPQQVLEAFRRIGVPLKNTRSIHMDQFADEYPLIDKFLEYRGLQKLLTSHGENIFRFIHPVTGRIHANFLQIGTPSGRLACHDPNLQQVPRSVNYRSCFIAPTGRKFIVADYSQIELRILAGLANDTTLISAFESGVDLHKTIASQMFGIPLENVTTEYREAAKKLNYGIVYGMGAKGLGRITGRTLSESEELIDKYFATYREVARWLHQAGDQAVKTRSSRTKLGRLVAYSFDVDDQTEVAAINRYGRNTPIQGTSSEITKRAMVLLSERLAGISARLINSIHDELIVEVDDDEAEKIAWQVDSLMVAAGNELIPNVPIVVDPKVAQSWVK
ncbi:MAG: DNA polymerase [Acidobacteriota bacterium]